MRNNRPFSLVSTPLQIGSVFIKNRIFFPPVCLNWANSDGTLSEKLANFYISLAKGGCGLIITGCCAVSSDSILYNRCMRLYNMDHAKGLKRLCSEIIKHGSIPAIQLTNFGRQSITTYTGKPVYAPSAIPCPVKSKVDPNYEIREMTLDDIDRVKNDFVTAAILAADSGFKIIQLHAAHGFLLNEFLSTYTNQRTDKYGGSVENRTRFIVEIIREIRNKIGNDILIDIRVSADEFVEGGLRPDDYRHIVPILEEAGIDMINVSCTIGETAGTIFKGGKEPQGRYANLAIQLKKYSSTPVAYTGFVATLETAEVLLNKKIDLIGMGRQQIADPFTVKKETEGKRNEINACNFDNACVNSLSNKSINEVICIKHKVPPE